MGLDVRHTLRKNAEVAPNVVAMTDGLHRRSHADLESRTNRLARALRGRGLGVGDRIAYLGRNSIEFFELLLAAAKVDLITVPLNWRLTQPEVRMLVDDCAASLVVTQQEFLPVIDGIPVQVVLESDAERLMSTYSDAPLEEGDQDPATVVLMIYTSGTTAAPKGALLSLGNLGQVLSCGTQLLMSPGDCVVLAAQQVFHVGGAVFGLYPIYFGGTLVLDAAFEPAMALIAIEEHRVTHLPAAPTIASMLADAQVTAPADLSSLRAVVYGGAPFTQSELERVVRVLGVPMINTYGMSECPAISYLAAHEHTPELLGSIGRPFPGVEVEVRVPGTTQVAAPHEVGELWVRSAGCIPGYWRRPEDNQNLYPEPEWLRTGDLGHEDLAGYLFLDGRENDLIITGGENVFPGEVERVLVTHPDIAEVAVAGIPDSRWGELVVAYVVLRPGADLTPDRLMSWCRPLLPTYRRPRSVTFLDELPKNFFGKVLRRELIRGA